MKPYEYTCAIHGSFRSDTRADSIKCSYEDAMGYPCNRPARRVWGFAFKPIMHGHYNNAVGGYVSSEAQFRSELARASEAASTPHTIIDDVGEKHEIAKPQHNFVPVDWRDKEALGVTNQGLDATYDRMIQQGRDSDARKLKKLMDE